MIPYFLWLALPILARIIGKKYRITSGNKILCRTQTASIDIFMFVFFLLLAFRGLHCGSDTSRYMHWYNVYGAQSFPELWGNYERERAYKLLNKLVSLLLDDYQVFLAVAALICVCPLWYFYKRESENQVLTIALFLGVVPYMMYFSGIRQAIAMSLGIPVWYAAKDKKLLRFILLVILATQFHTSAFVLLLLYPLFRAKITKKWLWVVIPGMLAVFVFRTAIFTVLSQLLWQEYSTIQETGATTILMLLILFALYSYIIPDENETDADTIALRNILLLSVVLQIFAMLHPVAMRMNYYFLIFVPILIPKIANRSKKQYAQIARLSVIVMSAYFMFYFVRGVMIDKDSLNIYPYIPFWKN